MTTQPEEAVGGEPTPVDELTVEERIKNVFQQDEPEPEPEVAGEEVEPEPETDEAEVEVEPEPEVEVDPIDAPNSWDAEAKERFARLPREDQEYIAKRENERDRFLQQKSQEAVQVKQQVTAEAMQAVEQIKLQQAEEFETFAAQYAPQKPPYQLMAENPAEYAYQMQVYEHQLAQRQHAQQLAHQRRQEAHFIQQQQEQQAAAEQAQRIEAAMREHFPEYLDPNEGPKLREALGSVAIDLGYSPEQLAQVDERDILAMRKAADWKAKAEKWDRAMAKQMERVRQGKNKLPPIATPGVSQGPGAMQASNLRQATDRLRQSGSIDDAAAALKQILRK